MNNVARYEFFDSIVAVVRNSQQAQFLETTVPPKRVIDFG